MPTTEGGTLKRPSGLSTHRRQFSSQRMSGRYPKTNTGDCARSTQQVFGKQTSTQPNHTNKTTTHNTTTTTCADENAHPKPTQSKQQPRPTPNTHAGEATLARYHNRTKPKTDTTPRTQRHDGPRRRPIQNVPRKQHSARRVGRKNKVQNTLHRDVPTSFTTQPQPTTRANDTRPNAKNSNLNNTQRFNSNNHAITMVQRSLV